MISQYLRIIVEALIEKMSFEVHDVRVAEEQIGLGWEVHGSGQDHDDL